MVPRGISLVPFRHMCLGRGFVYIAVPTKTDVGGEWMENQSTVLSILVENNPGVLARVAGLFSRRGFNIDSLTVGETQDSKISRMTVTVTADRQALEQIKKQVNKLVDVIKVIELHPERAVFREIALVKVEANPQNRAEIIQFVDIFRGKIVDVAPRSLVIEITGDSSKVREFIALLDNYGVIKEFVRTGITALERGSKQIDQYNKFEEG